MKQITWRTNTCLVLMALTILGTIPAVFITNVIPAVTLVAIIALGIIFSCTALFTKTEKKSARLIITAIFFALLLFWIIAVIHLGATGIYDN